MPRSRNLAFVFALALGASALAGCGELPTQPDPTAWEARITSEGPRPGGFDGQVGAASQFGRTSLSISLQRAEPDTRFRWHLIRGSCDQTLGTLGPADRYPLLTIGQAGTVQASATLNLMLETGESYAVVVSDEAGIRRYGCGNLVQK
jgi:hypothetical protein